MAADDEPVPSSEPDQIAADGGLEILQLAAGSGDAAQAGDTVVVHYHGTLEDGSVFDSSRTRGTPFEFSLGKNMVIAGFERTVTGMRIGGVRRVTIPPELGYGERGRPPKIPENATLIFEIELLEIK